MPARKFNLLTVDDDPMICRFITKVVSDALGNTVSVVSLSDPHEAKRWLDDNRCDILLTDIEMPGVDGLEMLRFAKQRNAWTQVIFITGNSTWDHIADAIENGASDYLLKPIDSHELIQLVSQECARQARWQNVILGTLKAAAI